MEGAIESTWGQSAKESYKSAIKHFDCFLADYYRKRSPASMVRKLFGLPETQNPLDLPKEAFTLDTIKNVAMVDASLLNKFAYYLAKLARGFTRQKEPLSYNSAMRYLSAMKQSRVRKDFDKNGIQPIPKEKMSLIYAGMLKLFIQRHRESRTPMVKSHYTATRREIVVLMMLCLWSDEPRYAEFGTFLLSLLQFAARAHECSVLRFDTIEMVSPPEFDDQECIAQQSVFRDKVYENQSVPIFNDRDSFFTDWYFNTFISMMSKQNQEATGEMFRSMNSGQTNAAPLVNEDTDERLGAVADLDAPDLDHESVPVLETMVEESDNDDGEPVGPSTRRKKKGTSASDKFGKLVKLLSDMSSDLLQDYDMEGADMYSNQQYLEETVGGNMSISPQLSSHSGK